MSKNNNRNKEMQAQDQVLTTELVSAVNVMDVTNDPNENIEDLMVFPLAIMHYGVKWGDAIKDSLNNHRAALEGLANEYASQYFASVDPATAEDIVKSLENVLINSAYYFSRVCSAWKYQNCKKVVDKSGNPLNYPLAYLEDWSNYIGTARDNQIMSRTQYNFNMSNAEWKQDVLGGLQKIILPKSAADFIHTLCAYFVQLKNSDDSTTRLITCDTMDLINKAEGMSSKEDFVDDLKDTLSQIQGSLNKYQFLRAMAYKVVGNFNPTDYDFTRDLAAQTMNLIYDRNDDFYNAFNSTGTISNTLNLLDESDWFFFRAVTDLRKGGAFFTDQFGTHTLDYTARVLVHINTYMNALRGNLMPLNFVALVRDYPTIEWSFIAGSPYYHRYNNFEIVEQLNQSTLWFDAVNCLSIQSALDLPIAPVVFVPDAVTITPATENTSIYATMTSYKALYRFGAKTFVISADDIESVISDANYNLWYNNYGVKESTTVVEETQTLGNSGSNAEM